MRRPLSIVAAAFAAIVLIVAPARAGGSQDPAGPAAVAGYLDALADFDYARRSRAARMVRRLPPADAVPALTEAVRGHKDEFVRYRALVLLTSFNDPATPDLMRAMLQDRNDRIREIAYRWFERRPDPQLATALLAALETEQSEFVRPALVRAVAALGAIPAVQRALIAEIGRGFDFFRSAVVDALGEHRASYAFEAIAAVARAEGPLQDDAVLAIGRIGHASGAAVLADLSAVSPDVMPALQAAHCMLGDGCAARIAWLRDASNRSTTATGARATAALGTVGSIDASARSALMDLARTGTARLRNDAALALSGDALRNPNDFVDWLLQLAPADQAHAVELLAAGFESLEEDFAEEQFFAAVRAVYWKQDEGSPARLVIAGLIDKLEF